MTSTSQEMRPEPSMKSLLQHGECCNVCHGFPFEGPGDCCSVHTGSSGCFPQADTQIFKRFAQGSGYFLGVTNLDGGVLFQRCGGPLPLLNEFFEGVCCSTPRRHTIMVNAIWYQSLTNGACMRQCVACTVVLSRGNDDSNKGNQS